MHHEVIKDQLEKDQTKTADEEKDVKNHEKNFVLTSKGEKDEDHSLFVEVNPRSDADADAVADDVPNDRDSVSKCEKTCFSKSLDDANNELESCDNENVKDNVEDEETALVNGTSKIVIARAASSQSDSTEKNAVSRSRRSTKDVEVQDAEKQRIIKLTKKLTLIIVDVFFAVAIVAPLVVSFWQGLWTIIDIHDEYFPAYACFFLGMMIHATFAVLKNHLHAKFAQELKARSIPTRLSFRLVRIFYTYIFATGCIMHWRGAWIIFDHYTQIYNWFVYGATGTFVLILLLGRCVRNLIAPPYLVAIDKRGYVFHFPTRFHTNTRDWSLYILDCAFSVGVVGTLVVFVWRGVWVLFDLYLFPENAKYSAVGSIIIGYTIVVITFSLQPLMRYACTRLKGFPRLVVADIFLLLSFAGTVNVWRGVWNVLGLWLLPEDPELSCWITHLGCFTFLVLLNCSNSVLVRGVYIDAEEAEGKCAVFPCHYLRLFFKIEREKKEARRQNLVVASRDLATITERTEKEENGALLNATNSTRAAENPESLV